MFVIEYKWEQGKKEIPFDGPKSRGSIRTLRDVKEPISPYLNCSCLNFLKLRRDELPFWCLPWCYSCQESLDEVLWAKLSRDKLVLRQKQIWFGVYFKGVRDCMLALDLLISLRHLYPLDLLIFTPLVKKRSEVAHSGHNLHADTCFPWGQLWCKGSWGAATALKRKCQYFLNPSINLFFCTHSRRVCLLYAANNKPLSDKSVVLYVYIALLCVSMMNLHIYI